MLGTITFSAPNMLLCIKNIDNVSHSALLPYLHPWEKSSPLGKKHVNWSADLVGFSFDISIPEHCVLEKGNQM